MREIVHLLVCACMDKSLELITMYWQTFFSVSNPRSVLPVHILHETSKAAADVQNITNPGDHLPIAGENESTGITSKDEEELVGVVDENESTGITSKNEEELVDVVDENESTGITSKDEEELVDVVDEIELTVEEFINLEKKDREKQYLPMKKSVPKGLKSADPSVWESYTVAALKKHIVSVANIALPAGTKKADIVRLLAEHYKEKPATEF